MRLIMKVESGDGCTYSCEEHFPIIFSSKEEFIIALEDKLVQIQVELEKHNKKMQEHQVYLHPLFAKHKGINSASKEISAALVLMGELQQEQCNLRRFQLGGMVLSAEMFMQDSKITLPDVFTLDEYFQEVENA